MTDLFEFKSVSENVDPSEIRDMLPQWKTLVLEAFYIDQETFPILQIKFLIEANNSDDIKRWIRELEDCTKTKYSIRNTYHTTGRYVEFRQKLVCHHFTRYKDVYDSTKKRHRESRNTDCPSKLAVTLHAIKKRYQGKDIEKHELLKKMPCEIIYDVTHNHAIGTIDSLRFRHVSDEVKLQLFELYRNGHSAASALESIKIDIQINNDNYEELLADRKFCPTYYDCYTLYKAFKKINEDHFATESSSTENSFDLQNSDEDNHEQEESPHENSDMDDYEDFDTENFSTTSSSPGNDCELQNNDEDEDNSHENNNMHVYFDAVDKIFNLFREFLKQSPDDVGPSLLKMLETVEKIETPSMFAAYNNSYGKGSGRLKRKLVERTTLKTKIKEEFNDQ